MGCSQGAIMRRIIFVLAMALLSGAALAQETGGLSPKAGAYSESLYTNVYFSFNFKVPQKWNVSWVAQDGPCGNECMLLDVRHPAYPKPMQMIQISAEAVKPQAALREASAGVFLVQAGAKKLTEPKELVVNGITFYRTDYRSQLANGEMFQSLVLLPGKDYAAVFTFAANSRRELEMLVDDFGKAFSKMGAK
jgi:hypothetical protein